MPQYELNLRDYWQIIQKRHLILLSVFLVVLISTIAYTHTQKPLYRATASVQWIERKALGGMLTELVSAPSGDPLLTQARVIRSRDILKKVAIELGLMSKDATEEELNARAQVLQQAVRTEVIENTNIIRIDVIYPEPQQAAVIANKVAEVYITENTHQRNKQNRMVREFIDKQLEEAGSKLKDSEDKLVKFQETEVPSGIALSLQNRLADLETKRQELLREFTEKHPDIISIKDQMDQTRERMKGLPQKELEYARFTREVEINARIYRELKEKLEAARIAEAEKIEDVTLVESALPPTSPISPNKQVNYLLGTLLGLMLGLTGIFLIEQLDTSIGTIEDVESQLKLPTLGVIPYLRTKDEKEAGFIQRLWPKQFKGKEKVLRLRNQLLIHYSSSSPIFESYRILRTNIQTEVFKDKIQGKILLVTSAGPEEGKSITIANLAVTIAQGGLRTLLVDADMRRATIHDIFGMKHREPGLCDILRGSIEYKDAIRTLTDILTGEIGFDEALKLPGLDNLSIITAGSHSTTPAELLNSAEMQNLLNNLKAIFDIILIDSPPVLAVADGTILAPKTDGVILVYRVGKTARSVLAHAKTQLIESGAQVKGVILNNISPEIEMRYGYYYQYKYYGKYYSEKKEGA